MSSITPTVSVVVPTFNRPRRLARAIESMSEDIELIVIDDGSSRETSEVVKACRHPRLRYARKANGGPASARNLGIQMATTPMIAFTDDDCIPLGGWPWPLARRIQLEGVHVAGAGGRVVSARDDIISRYCTYHRILEPPPSVSYLVTANCLFRRGALLEVGGFDERLRSPGGEDPDLSIRLRNRGYCLVYEPNAIVAHEFRNSLIDFARTFYRYGRGCSLVLGK